ncbi:DTW domain-containing protein YfiP [Bradyrhizobium niftali]
MSNLTAAAPADPIPECPHCQKPMPLCICDSVTPVENRLGLLILQHPQEQDRALGTARLTAKHFPKAVVRVGLSWPSLSKALGQPVENASHWAVLYLGSARAADLEAEAEIVALTRKGEVAENQRAILGKLEGIVLLDGTWSQGQGAVVAQSLDAEMPARDPQSVAPLALRTAAQGAAQGRAVDHRGGRDDACRSRTAPRHRRDLVREFRADAGALS